MRQEQCPVSDANALKVCLAFGMDLRTMSNVPGLPEEKQLGDTVFCCLYDILVHEQGYIGVVV